MFKSNDLGVFLASHDSAESEYSVVIIVYIGVWLVSSYTLNIILCTTQGIN